MPRTSWKTVEHPARIEYEVKKSVFIADVAPVATGEDAGTDFCIFACINVLRTNAVGNDG